MNSLFSKRLKQLRLERGLTQKDVASLLRISPSTYRDWEMGKQIKGEPYVEIAAVFGVSLTMLLTVKESKGDEILEHVRALERIVQTIRIHAAAL